MMICGRVIREKKKGYTKQERMVPNHVKAKRECGSDMAGHRVVAVLWP